MPHLSNNKQLENILFKPYKKQSASNEWAKREVDIIDSTSFVVCMCKQLCHCGKNYASQKIDHGSACCICNLGRCIDVRGSATSLDRKERQNV